MQKARGPQMTEYGRILKQDLLPRVDTVAIRSQSLDPLDLYFLLNPVMNNFCKIECCGNKVLQIV